MRPAAVLFLVLVSAASACCNPVPIPRSQMHSTPDSVWTLEVSVPCTLRWDDTVFNAPLVFSFRVDTLRINGTRVPVDPDPAWVQPPSGQPEDARIDELATEAELEEWLVAHRDREVVGELQYTDGSRTIVSRLTRDPDWDLVVSRMRSGEPFSSRMWLLVTALIRELELRGEVGIRDGAVSTGRAQAGAGSGGSAARGDRAGGRAFPALDDAAGAW